MMSVKLLEYKKFKEVSPELLKTRIVGVSPEEFQKAKEMEEFLDIMGITMYSNKRLPWMKRVVKAHRRKSKYQEITGTNWNRIEILKRR